MSSLKSIYHFPGKKNMVDCSSEIMHFHRVGDPGIPVGSGSVISAGLDPKMYPGILVGSDTEKKNLYKIDRFR